MLGTQTFDSVVGRVALVTDKPDGQSVTVETFDEKTLKKYGKRVVFTFHTKRPTCTGQWLLLSGTSRTDEGKRKDGSPREKNRSYYSKPFDGSPRKDWRFFELKVQRMKRLSTKDVEEYLFKFLRRHVSSPSKRQDRDSLHLKAYLLKAVSSHILKDAEGRTEPTISLPSVPEV